MTDKEIAIDVASRVTGVSRRAILSPSRKWPAVEARMLIVLLLSRDGYKDEQIAWALNRGRGAILKSRHNANERMDISKVFREKYHTIKTKYNERKSLRISEARVS